MSNFRIWAIVIIVLTVALGYGALTYSEFRLGLDLSGGTSLTYRADTSEIASEDEDDSLDALRDVIERRVNLFGVVEPRVARETVSFGLPEPEERLRIELPGITDVDRAIEIIGETPVLEFKTERDAVGRDNILAIYEDLQERAAAGEDVSFQLESLPDPYYVDTGLTGRYLDSARLDFQQGGHSGTGVTEPVVLLNFNREGQELFADITSNNIGKVVAIYLDGAPISQPVVNDAITHGTAQISGGFTPDEARLLVGRLNSGALPVPIELVSTNKVDAVLGADAVSKGVRAGLIGLALVAIFLIVYYRGPGLLSVLALLTYAVVMLALFKLIPVTLTSAGIAGFVLSIGMAVDANVLIFERMKEERQRGLKGKQLIDTAFTRAWASIRDGNVSSLLTALVLFWFGTSLIQGFAITFGLGVLVSMLTALLVTKTLLLATIAKQDVRN